MSPPDEIERIDRLFRMLNGYAGFASGVEYAEGYERPWLRRETVEYLTT